MFTGFYSEFNRTNAWNGQIDTLRRGQDLLASYDYLGSRTARRSYHTTTPVQGDTTYDDLGRVTGIDAGANLVKFDYTYWDNESNIRRKIFDHRSGDPYNEYTYDDIDRVTGITYLDSDTESFVMDDLGNRAGNQTLRDDGTVNFAVDTETNRYTAIDSASLDYDASGNLTTDKDGYVYTYDYENRIVKIIDDEETLIAEFDYDTQGRRIRIYDAVADETTLYYYSDNWQVMAEYDNSNNLQAYYVYGNYIDETLLMHRDSADKLYLHDHLYSPTALLDDTGAVVERYEYDAYGKASYLSSGFGVLSSSAYDNPYLFTGQRLDLLDSDDYEKLHYRYRDYEIYSGRFFQYDPLGIQPAADKKINSFSSHKQYFDGPNLYQYVEGNPVNWYDFYGLSSCDCQRNADLQLLVNPKLINLRNFIEQMSCEFPKVFCRDDSQDSMCTKNAGRSKVGGYHDSKNNKIVLCSSRNLTPLQIELFLVHEITHALDACRRKSIKDDFINQIEQQYGPCHSQACLEVRAYINDGRCDRYKNDQGKYRDCVIDAAAQSVEGVAKDAMQKGADGKERYKACDTVAEAKEVASEIYFQCKDYGLIGDGRWGCL